MPSDVDAIAARLETVRGRTMRLFAPLGAETLRRAPDPIMSPPLWDLGHIAAYEELWLVRRLAGGEALHPELDALYDAFETPRPAREGAAMLERDACLGFMDRVRERALAALAEADLSPEAPPLSAGGFVFELVALHEAQHTETVLQAMQMLPAGEYVPPRTADPATRAPDGPDTVRVPGGTHMVGAAAAGFAYDCERPVHPVELPAFRIGRRPVANRQWIEFIRDGGYRRTDLWTAAGAAWLAQTGAQAPAYWEPDGEGGWIARRYDRWESLPPEAPVCHVSAHEADAFARWAGARLPSEAEWEAAARWSGAEAVPGGLGQAAFAPGAGAPANAGRCEGMIGDVWEWTASGFEGYPGFRAFPYREYSEVFFGGPYRVLRGGSWATQAEAVSASWRNWDLPQRRQIFSGLRLAEDV